MECVSLLGSQLAPEDLIGVPQIEDGTSHFCPPRSIARKEPYCLFLDELNACSHEVQKAFYSLIHERRIGDYYLPEGSIVIGAGNRAQDSAIVKPMSSALVNRMVHVHLRVSFREWMEWAEANEIHPLVLDYVRLRSDHLWSQPPKHEEPFSTPRAWHMVSDALRAFGETFTDSQLETIAFGCLSPHHAGQFKAFHKQVGGRFQLEAILKGETGWPHKPEDRDVLYFLSQSFRARIRVVFCDAATYDQGYMSPDAIADRVQIKGRGGTILQPAIDLLENAADFPKDGPLLLITDGQCDQLRILRHHAILIPKGGRLPFTPRGPVFRLQ